jgi:protein SCO1/2
VKSHFVKNAFWFAHVFFSVLVISSGGLARAENTSSMAASPREQVASAPKVQVELKADPKKVPDELDGVGVKEHLGGRVSLEEIFLIDAESGQKKLLKDYFVSGKPTLINLVYFECPMLCTMVLNGVNEGLKKLAWSVGKEFNVLTVSINPNDTSAMARAKKENYLKDYVKEGHDPQLAHSGWSFATADENQVRKLAAELGFEYKYDQIQKQYAHPAVTFMLTPKGVVSRYLYGITYDPRNLKLALLEASQGKIGSVFDRLLMFCYHYEPLARGYSIQAMKVMQLGAVAIIALLGGYLVVFWTRQRKGKTK